MSRGFCLSFKVRRAVDSLVALAVPGGNQDLPRSHQKNMLRQRPEATRHCGVLPRRQDRQSNNAETRRLSKCQRCRLIQNLAANSSFNHVVQIECESPAPSGCGINSDMNLSGFNPNCSLGIEHEAQSSSESGLKQLTPSSWTNHLHAEHRRVRNFDGRQDPALIAQVCANHSIKPAETGNRVRTCK